MESPSPVHRRIVPGGGAGLPPQSSKCTRDKKRSRISAARVRAEEGEYEERASSAAEVRGKHREEERRAHKLVSREAGSNISEWRDWHSRRGTVAVLAQGGDARQRARVPAQQRRRACRTRVTAPRASSGFRACWGDIRPKHGHGLGFGRRAGVRRESVPQEAHSQYPRRGPL